VVLNKARRFITVQKSSIVNNKDQQIATCLQEGKKYKQIQQELKVSPCRISSIKKIIERQEILKAALSNIDDDENSSKSSKNGSNSSENALYSHQNLHSAGLNGSEIAEIVAFRKVQLDFRKEKWQSTLELEKIQHANQKLFNENQEKELKLRAEELQFKIKEAERPLKILFSRLKQLIDGKYDANIKPDEVRYYLECAKTLKTDYHAYAFAENITIDYSPHMRSINEFIQMFEKLNNDMEKDPKSISDASIHIGIMCIKPNLYGVDYTVC
jgi:hypothetical protein